MEDQAEKMEALKKAYAEIILNTAKEAAARAMASECKALRFHHDLRHTKDEALQMLLRFKNMIDSATTEAGKTSMSQQKRIDELDAQLNETEVVILDLRAELRNAHARLEEAKNSHSHSHMDNSETTLIKKNPDTNEHFIPSSECSKSYNPAKENSFFINTNPKELELYRNGYTHRIRAIERNLVDEKSIISDDNNETSTKNKDEILEENQNSGCSLRRSIRKRKVRCWDEISSLFKSHKKYSDNDDVEFDEHAHIDNYKSKALSKVNQTIVPISASINASDSEANKCEEKDVETDSVVSGCGGTNDKNRVLKYTFSRKRKKGLLTKSDNDKSNLKEEASSDSQNMIEVACQLISLRRVML